MPHTDIDQIKSSSPLVSWLMCTNKIDDFLFRAIESCLCQTMNDFELLLIVNGSNYLHITEILSKKYSSDDRIRIVGTPVHFLNFSLTLGLHLARSNFVARMDADDIAMPDRLANQYSYLKSNEDVVVLGSSYYLIDSKNNIHGLVDVPLTDSDIRNALFYRNPICHPSVMLRRKAILEVGGYIGGIFAEDYDLWLRICSNKKWSFANISTPLLSYNISPSGQARGSHLAYFNSSVILLRQFFLTGRFPCLIGFFHNVFKGFFSKKHK